MNLNRCLRLRAGHVLRAALLISLAVSNASNAEAHSVPPSAMLIDVGFDSPQQ